MVQKLVDVEVVQLYPVDSRDETVTAGDAVDITEYESDMLVVLDAEALTGTDPTLDLAIQHRQDSDDSWAAIDSDALYDPDDAEPETFTQVTDAAASFQTLALRRAMLKAQLRAVLTIGGTTPDGICAVYLVARPKYSAGW